ncbi:MAG: ABC transporter ATP-binding protein [Clostridium sp.]|jgi:putative ABC transport system ATP-binding protein|nr:ABC transporter ATP-binding protein [Clostridium sp.]
MGREVIIKADKLKKEYVVDDQRNLIIKGMDLEIYKGEFTVIMGSSGSGKSTLLYLLSGLEKTTSGNIYINGKNLTEFSEKETAVYRRNGMSFVYQNINLLDNLSLLENVILPGYILGDSKDSVNKRAKELLESVGLAKEMNKLPVKVSGGQQQRCAIARALINNPPVIFADEPTGALNSKTGKEILDLLEKVRDDGHTIVMVTHDIKAALRADRIIFITDGCIRGDLSLLGTSKAEKEKKVVDYLESMGW